MAKRGQGGFGDEERTARLAAALRVNLRKRKTRQQQQDPATAPISEPVKDP